jgi:hypothetical protein
MERSATTRRQLDVQGGRPAMKGKSNLLPAHGEKWAIVLRFEGSAPP